MVLIKSSISYLVNNQINIYDQCGGDQFCFGIPDDCVSMSNCDFLLTVPNALVDTNEIVLYIKDNGGIEEVMVNFVKSTNFTTIDGEFV